MENNPEYFSEIVYLRAIAILAVISIHVSVFFNKMSGITFLTLLYMSINTLSQFAVPLFVCISGFVLYNKYQGLYSLKRFYKKRFLSVVPQYTFFTVLAFLFVYMGRNDLGRVQNFDAMDLIYQYLTGTAFVHLWFFVLIIQLYIFYPIIEKIYSKSVETHKIVELLIFLCVVQILYQIFSIGDIFLIGKVTTLLGYIFYFVLGMYVRSYYLDHKNMIMTLKHPYTLFLTLLFATILGIGSWWIEYFSNNLVPQIIQIYNWIFAIVSPLYYIVIFILCLYTALKITEIIPNRFTKSMQIIGNYSFGIYLVHVFILRILQFSLFPKIGFDMNNWLFFPIVFTLVLAISLVSVYLINKFPYHEFIIGSLR